MIGIWRWTLAVPDLVLRYSTWLFLFQNCENRRLPFGERRHFFQYSGLRGYRHIDITVVDVGIFILFFFYLINIVSSTRTSVEAMMLSCKYSDALCCSSASALRKLLCCLKTSCIWLRISGNRLTNLIYVESNNARVIGEHRWYYERHINLLCYFSQYISPVEIFREWRHAYFGM